jgi:MFS transporter, DHA3 family, macrolide efflux protein
MKLSKNNPLRRSGYRFFMLFHLATSIGGGFHFVASHWILYDETESPASTAWLVICYLMPPLLLLPFCGVLADRCNRRKVLLLSTCYVLLLDSLLVAMIAWGVFQASHLYVYAVLMTMGSTLFWTTLPAFLREHLSKAELLHANSLNTALMQGGYLLGAGVAGILYGRIGGIGSFSVAAAGFAIAAFGWFFIRRWFPDRPRKPKGRIGFRSFFKEFAEGLGYAREKKSLFFFALFGLAPSYAAHLANVLLVGFSTDSLQAGSEGFGLLDMSYGLGAMICGLGLPIFLQRFGMRATLPTIALLLVAMNCILVSFSQSLAFAMFYFAGFAMFGQLVGILANTTLQRQCKEEVVGRLVSLVNLVQYLFAPILVWGLGAYAESPRGRILHEAPLRDGFVAIAILFLLLAAASLFGTYPFLKKMKEETSD